MILVLHSMFSLMVPLGDYLDCNLFSHNNPKILLFGSPAGWHQSPFPGLKCSCPSKLHCPPLLRIRDRRRAEEKPAPHLWEQGGWRRSVYDKSCSLQGSTPALPEAGISPATLLVTYSPWGLGGSPLLEILGMGEAEGVKGRGSGVRRRPPLVVLGPAMSSCHVACLKVLLTHGVPHCAPDLHSSNSQPISAQGNAVLPWLRPKPRNRPRLLPSFAPPSKLPANLVALSSK